MTMSSSDSAVKRWLWRLVKITLGIGAFLLVILTVLMNMGGTSETLKNTIEQYVSEQTGYHARIETLYGMTFFPNIAFDFENMTLHRDEAQDSPSVATVKRVILSMSFWDVMRRTGKVEMLNVSGLRADPNIFSPKAIWIKDMFIEDQGDKAAFIVDGRIGETDLDVTLSLAVSGDEDERKFYLGERRALHITLGDAELSGVVRDGTSGIIIDQLKAMLSYDTVLEGRLVAERPTPAIIRLGGALTFPEYGSVMEPQNLQLKHRQSGIFAEGVLKSPVFFAKDFAGNSRVQRYIRYVRGVFGQDDYRTALLNGMNGRVLFVSGDADYTALWGGRAVEALDREYFQDNSCVVMLLLMDDGQVDYSFVSDTLQASGEYLIGDDALGGTIAPYNEQGITLEGSLLEPDIRAADKDPSPEYPALHIALEDFDLSRHDYPCAFAPDDAP